MLRDDGKVTGGSRVKGLSCGSRKKGGCEESDDKGGCQEYK